jgi:hypothetical protein
MANLDFLIASQSQVAEILVRLRQEGFEATEGPEPPGNQFPLRVVVDNEAQEYEVEQVMMAVDPEAMHVGGFDLW